MCHIVLPSQESPSSRRHVLVGSGASLVAILTFNGGFLPLPVWAEDESNGQEDDEKGVVGAIKSLFDPNEKIKSGKVLPKAYLNSAREVVKTLRESLKEDPKDIAKFRRTADAAKESIREYLSSWRGKQTVVSEYKGSLQLSSTAYHTRTEHFAERLGNEESYAMLEKAIRSLASFYSKAGPSAALPEEVKSEILDDLNTAEEFL
ncbi:photosystem II D1 precursor processing protein PSB27-H2, chloroplastic isoform X3 [Vitis vinifera]|uniref:photosystem II D1 precursor processing protein PSB27-H2, chloroplastic isoform X3 n=1 Tax=Vitis vinifera TaxID=29760 RepID=UPI00053F2F59|nr:photosystem II D1 precursor processing protein PSB27-H2, chloroplastic isoform X3 [Vitis vinifera]|eukprot:XP_010649899.1 PREDICTED: photosystem II D1 precursor processing protein PSB27-H2, chloroplastic isoform X3 [Vitis vinifera]